MSLNSPLMTAPIVDGKPDRFSFTWSGFLNQLSTLLKPIANTGVYDIRTTSSSNAPVNGDTIQMDDRVMDLILEPAAGIAGLTVKLPLNPVKGEPVYISTTQAITTLTVQGGTVHGVTATVKNGSIGMVAGQGVSFIYLPTDNNGKNINTWYRRF